MKFTYLLVFTLFTQIISAASSNSPASPVTAIAHTGDNAVLAALI